MSQFTNEEHDTIRNGVMGAIALVSQAEPGFLATFKESMAASKALAAAPADFAQLMKGGMSMPPQASSKEEMVSKLLGNLTQAVQVASKDPATAEALKNYVTAACQQVAEASKGVGPEESAMIEQIQGVLNQAPAAQTPAAPAAPAEQVPAEQTPAAPVEDAPVQQAPVEQAPTPEAQAPADGSAGLQWPKS